MATEPKKTQDDDPLQRAASQGFAEPPTPEPTTEQVQRAMHPRDYDQWKAAEDAKLKRAEKIKNATLAATKEADEEAEKAHKEAEQKALASAKNKPGYETRAMQAKPAAPTPPTPPAPPKA